MADRLLGLLDAAAALADNGGMNKPVSSFCPCGRERPYAACCEPLHQGQPAADAEALMRSRYSAYVLGNADYVRASWHPDTRPEQLQLDEPAGQRTQWLGLTVKQHTVTGTDTAEVVFLARYRIGGGSALRMEEHSRFVRIAPHWYYLDAV